MVKINEIFKVQDEQLLFLYRVREFPKKFPRSKLFSFQQTFTNDDIFDIAFNPKIAKEEGKKDYFHILAERRKIQSWEIFRKFSHASH